MLTQLSFLNNKIQKTYWSLLNCLLMLFFSSSKCMLTCI